MAKKNYCERFNERYIEKNIEILKVTNSMPSVIRVTNSFNGSYSFMYYNASEEGLLDKYENSCYQKICEVAKEKGYSSTLDFIKNSGKVINKTDDKFESIFLEDEIENKIKNLKIYRNINVLVGSASLVGFCNVNAIIHPFAAGTLAGFAGLMYTRALDNQKQIKKEEKQLIKLKSK